MLAISFMVSFKTVNEGDAVVYLSINEDLMKIDVELGSIPTNREVTVNFSAPGLENDGVFYTDSNGLAMEKRILK